MKTILGTPINKCSLAAWWILLLLTTRFSSLMLLCVQLATKPKDGDSKTTTLPAPPAAMQRHCIATNRLCGAERDPARCRSTNNNQKPPLMSFIGGFLMGVFGYCS